MPNPIDLGRPFICLKGVDLPATDVFYEKLGFTSKKDLSPAQQAGNRFLRQGTTALAFFNFIKFPNVNYRGASIHAMATELTRHGFQCWGLNHRGPETQLFLDEDGNELPDNEAGAFTIFDPDGYKLFFNTHPPEREPYENNQWAVDHHMAAELAKGGEPALGKFIFRIDVADLAASRDFYERMGLAAEDAPDGAVDIVGQHPHMRQEPTTFPVRLRQADTPGAALLFRSDDPASVADSLRASGVEVEDGPDGPTLTDPNGQKLVLVSA
jgi:predicted lactoylglutathione lyase